MKKPNRNVITIITLISLILLFIFCIFLLKKEHDWRVKEEIRVEFLESVTPQLEQFHKKNFPYLTQLEPQAEWVDNELVLKYRIAIPNYLVDVVDKLLNSDYCNKHPDYKNMVISSLYYELEYLCSTVKYNIETDIPFVPTMQLIDQKVDQNNNIILWVSESEIIDCIVPFSDKNNLGEIEYSLGVSNITSPSSEEEPVSLFQQ